MIACVSLASRRLLAGLVGLAGLSDAVAVLNWIADRTIKSVQIDSESSLGDRRRPVHIITCKYAESTLWTIKVIF